MANRAGALQPPLVARRVEQLQEREAVARRAVAEAGTLARAGRRPTSAHRPRAAVRRARRRAGARAERGDHPGCAVAPLASGSSPTAAPRPAAPATARRPPSCCARFSNTCDGARPALDPSRGDTGLEPGPGRASSACTLPANPCPGADVVRPSLPYMFRSHTSSRHSSTQPRRRGPATAPASARRRPARPSPGRRASCRASPTGTRVVGLRDVRARRSSAQPLRERALDGASRCSDEAGCRSPPSTATAPRRRPSSSGKSGAAR